MHMYIKCIHIYIRIIFAKRNTGSPDTKETGYQQSMGGKWVEEKGKGRG